MKMHVKFRQAIFLLFIFLAFPVHAIFAAGPITGTFLDFNNYSLPTNQIEPYFAELEKLGMDTVIVGAIQTKTGNGDCASNSFQWLPSLPGKLDTVFSAAASHHLQVYVGLVSSYPCGTPHASPNKDIVTQYLTNYANPTNPIQYILTRFGNSPQFAGWYTGDEPWLGWDPSYTTSYDYYRNYVNAVKAKSNKPVITAPSFCGVDSFQTPDQLAAKTKAFKDATGIDIFAYQDCVNQLGISLTPGDRYTTGQYYQAIANQIGKNALWADLELGNCCLYPPPPAWGSGAYKPTALARLKKQIEMAPDTVVAKKVTFIGQFQMSQTLQERMLGADRLLAAYASRYTNNSGFSYVNPVSYTWVTTPSTQYPDTGTREMFDLRVGEAKNFDNYKPYLHPGYVGIKGPVELVISLNQTYTLAWLGVHTLHFDSVGIKFPESLSVSCSENNVNWSTPTQWSFPSSVEKKNSEYVFGNPGNSPLNIGGCKFLKLKLGNNPTNWTFLSEIEIVGGGALASPTPTPSSNQVFADVDATHWAYNAIQTLYHQGIASGCSTTPMRYCPDDAGTRAQVAVFLLRAKHGSGYSPPAITVSSFTDVPVSHWAATWINQLTAEGITGGCATNPPRFCPEDPVTRGQIAVMLLKTKHGGGYSPPAATGIFTDLTGHWAATWAEALYTRGITSGCSTAPLKFCPDRAVSRAEIAIFFTKTFTSPAAKSGDLNNDNKVDIFDYNILVTDFGKTGSAGWIKADIDKNGKVDIFDYNVLVGAFGK